MADIRSKLNMLYSLEQLSSGENAFKKLHPLSKLVVTAVYLVCVASLGKYDLTRLTLFLAYPVLVMAMAQIPWKMILKRAAVAMPFCIFAGVSNLIFDRTVIAYAGKIAVTGGMLSFAMLFCRTLLCVSAILILVAVTPFSVLMDQLRRLHVPELLVTLLEMVYRYIGVLVEEASGMVTAFRLRGNGAKWPEISEFGSFVGQLFLRSADRAERIYQAMQCRLYTLHSVQKKRPEWKLCDTIFLIAGAGTSVLFRWIDFTEILGGILL